MDKVKREKCGYADKYLGMLHPMCGCVACETKWASSPHNPLVYKKGKSVA